MKKKFDFRILIIVLLIIILTVMVCVYLNSNKQSSIKTNSTKTFVNKDTTAKTSTTSKITATSEVESALTEKLELHATYYYSEIYVEKSAIVAKGENILKYTNGTYLVAPYDCVITNISVPEVLGQCTNKHYIEISAINSLEVLVNISEKNVEKIQVGQTANVKITAIDKTVQGVISNISSTATNGNFTAKVEFENDGNIKLGMTSEVEIDINE